MDRRRHSLVGDDQLVAASAQPVVAHALRIADIAHADRRTEGVAETAAREIAGEFAVAENRLAADQNDVAILGGETAKLLAQRPRGGFLQGLATDEGQTLCELHETAEPGLEGIVVGGDIAAPGAIE